ncbi:TolB-like translocation protein [Paludisphaera rhizosphaerae]|uniref:hypothetical protein n=1 Tax=Paludisphaera rhizosphaerae TaxID=2711216 RepID=UPI0013ED23AF|nr:hypothetical protein [Paludisphaera rhizosphaerae]
MIHRCLRLVFGGACLLASLFPTAVQAQQAVAKAPDMAALAKAGRETIARLEKESASWTSTMHLPGSADVIVEMLSTPNGRRMTLSMSLRGQRAEAIRIVERDGVWYVKEHNKRGKYRPYEAPFLLPTAYIFLLRAEALAVNEAGPSPESYEGTTNGVASYRTPLPDSARRQLQSTLEHLEKLKALAPEKAAAPELVRIGEQGRELLDRGMPTKVDSTTGLIVLDGAPDRQTEMRDFRWLDAVDPNELRVDDQQWEDFADDPTAGDTSDLVLINHSGIWRPGQPAGDSDGRLLDVRTGRLRRIPLREPIVMSGCFLKDRAKVIVSGLDQARGGLDLYEVDLKTGANRRLGGERLAEGNTLMPACSPDGKTIAALHKPPAGDPLDATLVLVDVESGAARPLGVPRDQAFLSWTPDGKGLILLVREPLDPKDLNSPRTSSISRLDLDGRLTKLREGTMPVVLSDGRILFQDEKAHGWKTCNLEGGDEKEYAGGLAGYGFPAPAADGKRIFMMHFVPGQGPTPTVLPIDEAEGKPATTAPGLWSMPAWR